MSLGINLHDVVRSAITTLHPDEPCLWYRSTGHENVKGILLPAYAAPVPMKCQIQSDAKESLTVERRTDDNEVSRYFYLYTTRESRAAGIIRPDARGGDILRRQVDGSWWLVVAVPEDFAGVEWEKVRAVLQVTPPDAILPLAEEEVSA